ncbi:Uncharacterized protein BM_BM2758 [Brugia malayi]|uniref:Bm2758 n=1 Tax=Brugia malayi TaxID=6279 RepID=A0A0H5RZ87_BRUMA|nr:Uncharacterized protein BM_BM2758 [Brugia malayi]CRZ21805.1 Bm2758 [Brugia malayi]VIO89813.1 Uncharacterized protein BM_BM2758 [Brugia malayi]
MLSEKTKFVPSPMEMQNLIKPEMKQIIKHNCDEITSALIPQYFDPPIEQPQRAEIAFYRPFQPDPMNEMIFPEPIRYTVSYRDINNIIRLCKQLSVQLPESKRAKILYRKLTFNNVPSY